MINAVPYGNSSISNVNMRYVEATQEIVVIATNEISAGEPLKLHYRPDYTNAEYLRFYGFLFEDRPAISYIFDIDFWPEDSLIQAKAELIKKSLPNVAVVNRTVFIGAENTKVNELMKTLLSVLSLRSINDEFSLEIIKERFKKGEVMEEILGILISGSAENIVFFNQISNFIFCFKFNPIINIIP